jgi:hypothetical protein
VRPAGAGVIVAALVAAAGALGTSTAGASSPSAPKAITWLAAGDSYASGQGLTHTTEPCADGTGKNGLSTTWAVAAAATLRSQGVALAKSSPDLVACTGDISDQFFHTDGGKNGEPQWKPSMGRYDLVTFSFGGDDINFSNIVAHCEEFGCPSDQSVRTLIATMAKYGVSIHGTHTQPYHSFLQSVATKAVEPGGNIVVMGYPELVEDVGLWSAGRTTCAGMSAGEVQRLRGWAGDLNATIGSAVATVNALPAAQRNGVHLTFVNPVSGGGAISGSDPNLFEPSSGTRHELCSTPGPSWLNGESDLHLESRSFHPNQGGETAMGALAAEVVPTLTWPWTPSWRQLPDLSPAPGTDAQDLITCANGPFCLFDTGTATEEWSGGAWTPMPSAPDALDGLSCASSTFCMGVYDTDSTENDPAATTGVFTSYSRAWNGSTWGAPVEIDQFTSSTAEPYGVVQDVVCKSSTFCMALGGDFGSAVWNGATWHKTGGVTTGTDGGTGLACTSSAFCLATPAAPNTITWNGKAWGPATQSVPPPTDWLGNPACATATECFAPGNASTANGEYPYSFNGKTWSAGATTATPTSSAISCASMVYCIWGSDDGGGVSSLAGPTTWGAPVTLEPGVSAPIDAVSCTTTFCVATIGASTFLYSDTALGKPLSVAPSGPALGSAAWAASLPGGGVGVEGFGAVEPATIDLGGASADGGYVHSITWSSWGQSEATGQGSSLYVTNSSLPMSDQPDEPTNVVAYDLGTCGAGPAYTMLNWYYPTEGQSGPDPSTAINACTGVEAGPVPSAEPGAATGSSGNTGSTGNTGAQSSTGSSGNTGSTGNTGNS